MSSELDKLYAQRMIPKSEIKIENADIDDSVIFDINNRTINSGGVQDVLVEKDNICRTIKFRIQRHFEEIDLSTKSVSIRYTTPLGESDEAFGVNRNTETDYITFDWIISNKATSTSGELQFDVIFYSEDGYSWHTKSSILMVEKGLKVTTITPKPSQDWIDSWRSEAGKYLLDFSELQKKVDNAVDILEKALPSIEQSEQLCKEAVITIAADKSYVEKSVQEISEKVTFVSDTATVIEEKAREVSVNTDNVKKYTEDAKASADNAKDSEGKVSQNTALSSEHVSMSSHNKDLALEYRNKAEEYKNLAESYSESSAEKVVLSTEQANKAVTEANRAKSEADRAQSFADSAESDVVQVDLKINLPINGERTILYVVHSDTSDNNGFYKWDGTKYNIIDSIDGQVPSYTEATTPSKLVSGETVTVALGKIASSVTALIKHIADGVKHITSTERTLWNTVSNKLPLAGGIVTGTVTVGKVTGLNAPIGASDATSKSYVDAQVSSCGSTTTEYVNSKVGEETTARIAADEMLLPKANGTITGALTVNAVATFNNAPLMKGGLNLNSNFISNVKTPVSTNDGANKSYVDTEISKVSSAAITKAYVDTQIATREPIFTHNTAFNKNFGTTANTVCQGNDSRLSNARTASGGNSDTVNGSPAYRLQSVNTNQSPYGANAYDIQSRYNAKGDYRFRLEVVGGSDAANYTDKVSVGHASYADSSNYANSAGNSDTVDGLNASDFIRKVGVNSGYSVTFSGIGAEYSQSPIQLREVNNVQNAQTGWQYAPALGYHWGGVQAATIAMHSDGSFHFRAQNYTGSQYRSIICNTVNGATWNDYAEYRQSKHNINFGKIAIEDINNDDYIKECNERLNPTAMIISDTFGFSLGKQDIEEEYSLPIAVAGRALVYTDNDRSTFKAGDSVCSGLNGTVSKMTREEIINYPNCILGIVSSIPEYEKWGTGDVAINNRIWIRVR